MGGEGFGEIRVPARQSGTVFDDVAGAPFDPPSIDLARHFIVRAEDVEVASCHRIEHEIGHLPGRPGTLRLVDYAAPGLREVLGYA